MAQADSSMRSGRVVLITGGATGIGRAIAEAFLNCGHQVHVCDANQASSDAFLKTHPEAGATLTDVADIEQVDRMFDSLASQYARLDILVNNAGVAGPIARVEAISPAEWNQTVAVDLNGQFYCTRRAVPLLKAAGGGSIINIASNVVFFGMPMRAPYTACKWAMIGFTKTLAMFLASEQGSRISGQAIGLDGHTESLTNWLD